MVTLISLATFLVLGYFLKNAELGIILEALVGGPRTAAGSGRR